MRGKKGTDFLRKTTKKKISSSGERPQKNLITKRSKERMSRLRGVEGAGEPEETTSLKGGGKLADQTYCSIILKGCRVARVWKREPKEQEKLQEEGPRRRKDCSGKMQRTARIFLDGEGKHGKSGDWGGKRVSARRTVEKLRNP